MEMTVSFADILDASTRIRDRITRTPLVFSNALSLITGCQVYLKMECWQICGCFKVRGALNKVASLARSDLEKGLVTTSSGNHAIALAYAAGLNGHPPTTIFMPKNADPAKISKIRSLGVEPVFHGDNYLEAYDKGVDYCQQIGAVYIHSHADPYVISGQGTIGIEIMEELPGLDAVIVPIGGGGLISGISTAIKSQSLDVRIIGAEPAAAPSAFMSLRDGICHERITIKPSMADGLLGGIGQLPFEIMRKSVEQVVILEEDEIGRAVALLQDAEQVMAEAASSVGLAALLGGKLGLAGKTVVLVITSRNIDAAKYNAIIQQYGKGYDKQ